MIRGERFGRLVFTGEKEFRGKHTYGKFVCECGKEKFIRLDGVSCGVVKSCGCLYNERKNVVGLDSATYERLYNVWKNMIRRCEDKKSDRYASYGGRGIRVCEDWKNFKKFARWAVDNGWNKSISLERRDVNANYCPENCTFITMEEQQKNRTNNIKIEISGEKKCMSDWCRIYDVPYQTAWMRWKRGDRNPERIFFQGDLRSCSL